MLVHYKLFHPTKTFWTLEIETMWISWIEILPS